MMHREQERKTSGDPHAECRSGFPVFLYVYLSLSPSRSRRVAEAAERATSLFVFPALLRTKTAPNKVYSSFIASLLCSSIACSSPFRARWYFRSCVYESEEKQTTIGEVGEGKGRAT